MPTQCTAPHAKHVTKASGLCLMHIPSRTPSGTLRAVTDPWIHRANVWLQRDSPITFPLVRLGSGDSAGCLSKRRMYYKFPTRELLGSEIERRNPGCGMQVLASGPRQYGRSGAAGLQPLCRLAAVMQSGSACSQCLKLAPSGNPCYDCELQ